ncbi:MAG TPA: tetratricopeptide repeat protein [Xanthobacteraceae bacterium]|nr:tetratricopeptide repeat protein [Xanthobacteraceae bacterium]
MPEGRPVAARYRPMDLVQAYHDAVALQQQRHWREAAQIYGIILEREPDHLGALCGLGSIRRQQGEVDDAILLYRRAAIAAPHSADAQMSLGIIFAALNHHSEAAACYRAALAMRPNHIDAHNNLGNALLALGRAEEALAHYQKVLTIREDHSEAHNNLANALCALNRPQEAVAHLQRAIASNPAFVQAHCNLGLVLAQLNRHEEAMAHYRRVLAIKPDHAEAHGNLGNALCALGRFAEAAAEFQRALALNPALAQAHCNLGLLVGAREGPQAAIAHYERALAIQPDFLEVHHNLGNALRKLNRHQEAIAHYVKALAIAPPRRAEVHNNLGISLQALGRHQEAIGQYQQALKLDGNSAEVRNNLATVLQGLGQFDAAIAGYQAALAVKPDHAEAHNSIGVVLQALGRLEEASQAYERATKLAPRNTEFQLNFANSRRFSASDPRLAALQKLEDDLTSLNTEQQIPLYFALGKAYADLGENPRSFAYLLKANALKRAALNYDEAATLKRFERIQATFTGQLLREKSGVGDPSKVPVFVVGMPRSGTTLIEQILASHSEVFGAGEREDFNRAVLTRFGPREATASFPECLSSVTPETLAQFAAHYLEGIEESAPRARRVVDKMPLNFLFVGLIHLALPNARIIHACRDPLDTCFSCFSLLFAGHQPFAYDLGELGRYYRAYETLMAHWRAVLPPGVMIDVNYEDLVADLETQARRMVAHCDLDWQPRCLDFYKTPRGVRTASSTQVREPIYRHALGRSSRYQEFLEPLRQALGIVNSKP